ncbi:hypothetical protein PR202_ga13131 [Eleusine coracana subsp. coracana]|uniref:Uncharacterized protein n=1 Tax=Eleusine coracana subsp. coracana TaxID=191504 RepID=A0AAV5CE46_ELECO|nr:hypothetical protein PR202_ga13131 [Eleusine coracana subsp. coracana]
MYRIGISNWLAGPRNCSPFHHTPFALAIPIPTEPPRAIAHRDLTGVATPYRTVGDLRLEPPFPIISHLAASLNQNATTTKCSPFVHSPATFSQVIAGFELSVPFP